ncbi:MAG: hypothetical protein AB7H96_22390 [Vicinamibacterales bacterium]
MGQRNLWRVRRTVIRVVLCTLSIGAAACSRPSTAPSDPTTIPTGGPLVFRASPVAEDDLRFIVPLGNLNPPGHTFPTDHIYFYNRLPNAPPGAPVPVYAPGDGVVQFILGNGAESQVGVRTGRFIYYLDHVVLDAAIRTGVSVTAGQRIGTTGSSSYAVDLGVINELKTVTFINPLRYPGTTLHGDAPLPYFEEPLRSRLYARVQRLGADRDGRFDYDEAGRLVGNWFLEGTPVTESATATAWPRHLAFVYDNYDPSRVRVAIGGTLPVVGAFAVDGNGPDPRVVTPATGKVTYRLLYAGGAGDAPGPQRALLAVQMIDAMTIVVDVADSATATTVDVGSAARRYVR